MGDRWHCPFCRRIWAFRDLYLSHGGGYGCPRCLNCDVTLLCDEPRCDAPATDVWHTTKSNTRRTCAKHHNFWKRRK